MDTEEITRLYRVWKTIHAMLGDRDFAINQMNVEMSLDEFRKKFEQGTGSGRADLILLHSKKDDPNTKIFVFFTDDAKITIPVLNNYAKRMQSERVSKAIMISKDGISHSARTGIRELQPHFLIEHFQENELIVNITKHELVPEHLVLTVEEKDELLHRYRVKESQLPKIQMNDPVARYYGLIKGQVVKIIRASETAGRYITYRLVVDIKNEFIYLTSQSRFLLKAPSKAPPDLR